MMVHSQADPGLMFAVARLQALDPAAGHPGALGRLAAETPDLLGPGPPVIPDAPVPATQLAGEHECAGAAAVAHLLSPGAQQDPAGARSGALYPGCSIGLMVQFLRKELYSRMCTCGRTCLWHIHHSLLH